MAEKTITITVKLNDQYSAGMNKLTGSMNKATTATKQVGTATTEASSKMTQLANAVTGTIAVMGAFKAVGFVGEIVKMGEQVNITRQRFAALAKNIGASSDLLSKLRGSTGGIVDDLTLMEGAAALLGPGLATTGDQVADMIGKIIRLKKPTDDARTAINNFTLMLLNNSKLRLDSFSISASAVTDRMREMKKEFPEMTRSALFFAATMEEADVTLARFGDSAEAAMTSLARLEGGLASITQELAASVATGAGGIIGLIEIALGLNPIQQQQLAERMDEAELLVSAFQSRIMRALADNPLIETTGTTSLGGFDRAEVLLDAINQQVEAFIRLREEDPTRDIGRTDIIQAAQGQNRLNAQTQLSIAEEILKIESELALRKQQQVDRQAEQNEMMRRAIANQGLLRQIEMTRASLAEVRLVRERDQFRIAEHVANLTAREVAFENIPGIDTTEFAGEDFRIPPVFDAENFTKVPEFLTQDQADRIQQAADDSRALFEAAEDADIFSDDQLAGFESAVDETEKIADNAERAAKAFRDASVIDLLGATRPEGAAGRQEEIGRLVLDRLREQGADDETLERFERQLNLQTGRETVATVELEENIVPLIAEAVAQGQTDAALQAIINSEQFVSQTALAGLSPEQQAAFLGGSTGLQGGVPVTRTITPGTASTAQNQLGVSSLEELFRVTGATNQFNVPTGDFQVAGGVEQIPGFDVQNVIGGAIAPRQTAAAMGAGAAGFGGSVLEQAVAAGAERGIQQGFLGSIGGQALASVQGTPAFMGTNAAPSFGRMEGPQVPGVGDGGEGESAIDFLFGSDTEGSVAAIQEFVDSIGNLEEPVENLVTKAEEFAGQISESVGGVTDFVEQASEAQKLSDSIRKTFKALTTAVQEVKVKISIVDDGGLPGLIAGAQSLSGTVRDAGGSAPGTSGRASPEP